MALSANEVNILIKAKDEASKTLTGVNKNVQNLAKAAVGLAGAWASIKGFQSSISAAQALGGAVNKLSRETGLTTEASSQLLFTFKHFGLEANDASRSIGIFAKKLKGISDTETGVTTGGKSMTAVLAAIGVDATNASGGLRSVDELLPSLADRFKAMPNGLEKTGLAMQLFGRSGKDMIPILNQGAAGLKELAAQSDKLGLTLSAENVQKIRAFTLAQRDMGMAIAAVKVQIGLALMPILTKLMQGFIKVQPTIREFVATLIGGFQKVIAAVEPAKKVLGELFGLLSRKDLIAIFAALSAAIVAGLVAIAVQAAITFVAMNAALLGIPIAIAAVVTAITLLVRHWDTIWPALQKAPTALLNWLKNNWARVLIAIITGPIGIIVMNWKRIWNVMPEPVQQAMNFIAKIVERVINWILDRFSDLIDKIADISEQLNRLPFIDINVSGLRNLQATLNKGVSLTTKGGGGGFLSGLTTGIGGAFSKVAGAASEMKAKLSGTIGTLDDFGDELGSVEDATGGAGAAAEAAAEAIDILEDGLISLKEAQEKGIPAWAAARFEMVAAAKVMEEEVAEKAWRAQLGLLELSYALGDAGLTVDAFKAALAVEKGNQELRELADALGQAGVSGAAFRAAMALDMAKEALSDIRSDLDSLFGRPTREQAKLNLDIANLELRRAQMAAGGATGEQLRGIDAQIDALQRVNDVRRAEEAVIRARLDVADRSLLTDIEQMTKAQELIVKMGELSTAASPVIRLYNDQAVAMSDLLVVLRDWKDQLTMPPAGAASFQAGTSFVPSTGIYQLHRGEAVLTAAEARQGASGNHVEFYFTLQGLPEDMATEVQRAVERGLRRAGYGGSWVGSGAFTPS
jgi:hypothetical protein